MKADQGGDEERGAECDHTPEPTQAGRNIVGAGGASARVKDGPAHEQTIIGIIATESHSERESERGFAPAGVRAGVRGRFAADALPVTETTEGLGGGRAEPGGSPTQRVVGARGEFAKFFVALIAMADRGIQRIRGAIEKRPRSTRDDTPKSGATNPSFVLSARLSIVARLISDSSRAAVSRPTIIANRARAAPRSPARKGLNTART